MTGGLMRDTINLRFKIATRDRISCEVDQALQFELYKKTQSPLKYIAFFSLIASSRPFRPAAVTPMRCVSLPPKGKVLHEARDEGMDSEGGDGPGVGARPVRRRIPKS